MELPVPLPGAGLDRLAEQAGALETEHPFELAVGRNDLAGRIDDHELLGAASNAWATSDYDRGRAALRNRGPQAVVEAHVRAAIEGMPARMNPEPRWKNCVMTAACPLRPGARRMQAPGNCSAVCHATVRSPTGAAMGRLQMATGALMCGCDS
jgi:hypothetical protein